LAPEGQIVLRLRDPDALTATRLAEAINDALQEDRAQAPDPSTITIQVPRADEGRETALLARLSELRVQPAFPAKVTVNERTGTVAIGPGVRLLPVVISHGALKVEISTEFEVSQPAPFGAGETVVVPQTTLTAEEEESQVMALDSGETMDDLVKALNALKVNPRDLIAILQTLKRVGALLAELEII
jgi:flagellar P-ring protein precursor FlgI